jgi:hypothetical protein
MVLFEFFLRPGRVPTQAPLRTLLSPRSTTNRRREMCRTEERDGRTQTQAPTPTETEEIFRFLQRVGSDQTLPKELQLLANSLALCFRDRQEVQERLAVMLEVLLGPPGFRCQRQRQ